MYKEQEYQAQHAQSSMQNVGPSYTTQLNAPPPYSAPSDGFAQPSTFVQVAPPNEYAPPPPPTAYGNTGTSQGQQTIVTQTTITRDNNMTGLRRAIPELPLALAIVLCIINCILPGIGTIIAGFSVLCCGKVRHSDSSRGEAFCINFWIGILQLILYYFIVGWVWSIMWGVALVVIASDRRGQQTTTTTTTTVLAAPGHQPEPGQTYVYSVPQSQVMMAQE